MNCPYCNSALVIKKGKRSGKQRMLCNDCYKSFQSSYSYNAYNIDDKSISALLKDSVSIRGISRIYMISKYTVSKRILNISKRISYPVISRYKTYEVDELCTFVGSKNRRYWIAYSFCKETGTVVNMAVGKRNKTTLNQIIHSLVLSDPLKIYTDKLNIYKALIPSDVHVAKRYCTNQIERFNLNIRTHLKRLNRRTICYSKSLSMLIACLKIYFWG